MATAKRDDNAAPTLVGASKTDGVTPVRALADPVTGHILVEIVLSSHSTTGQTKTVDDNGAKVLRGVTNNSSKTVKPLIADPNNSGHVLADVSVV